MAHKIFRNAFLACMLVLVLCAALFCTVMYRQLEAQVYAELRIEASYVAAGLNASGEEFLASIVPERRITWVDSNGGVIYDNRADPSAMDNHSEREEISEAFATGSGESRHFSNTVMESTLYYALLMPDSTVIRVAATQDSLVSMLLGLLSPIAWSIFLILLLCGFLASRLARQITQPINSMDLDDPDSDNPYKELNPLVNRVREQNRTIRQQMDELSVKQRDFAAITENMSEGLILVDYKGNIIFSNQSGINAICPNGRELKVLSRAKCIPEVCDGLDAALAGVRYEKIVSSDSSAIELMVNPVVSNGHVSGAIVLVLDVTEREKRDELRREFSANVSHELKTPLTSISGFAELMKEGIVPEDKMREFSQDIYNESKRLISMIEDIIRLSRIDESAVEPECEMLDLLDISASVAESLKSAASKAEISLSVSGDRAYVFGNRQILDEMVYNLGENAIKYNKAGGTVKITVAETAGEIRLSVKDTGIGIPPEHHKRIFERFYRVDKSHSKAIGGTGLGLSIVRHGAKFHDARIELISRPGEGTEFIIVFPEKGEKK